MSKNKKVRLQWETVTYPNGVVMRIGTNEDDTIAEGIVVRYADQEDTQ